MDAWPRYRYPGEYYRGPGQDRSGSLCPDPMAAAQSPPVVAPACMGGDALVLQRVLVVHPVVRRRARNRRASIRRRGAIRTRWDFIQWLIRLRRQYASRGDVSGQAAAKLLLAQRLQRARQDIAVAEAHLRHLLQAAQDDIL